MNKRFRTAPELSSATRWRMRLTAIEDQRSKWTVFRCTINRNTTREGVAAQMAHNAFIIRSSSFVPRRRRSTFAPSPASHLLLVWCLSKVKNKVYRTSVMLGIARTMHRSIRLRDGLEDTCQSTDMPGFSKRSRSISELIGCSMAKRATILLLRHRVLSLVSCSSRVRSRDLVPV